MEQFFQQLTNGLAVGGIYALIALGYTMVYGVLKLINFAHGDLFTLGAYLGLTLLTSMALTNHLGPLWGDPAAGAHGDGARGLVGACSTASPIGRCGRSPRLSAVVSALGASIFLQNAVMLDLWRPLPGLPPEHPAQDGHRPVRDSPSRWCAFWSCAASLVMMAALYLFIQKTRIGTAIRAAAIDQDAARLMGIDVNRVILIVFLVGPGARAVLAGLMVGLYYGQINFTMGWGYGLKAFTAAILGGIGNIPGAMVGGLLLGVIEAMGAAYSPSPGKTPSRSVC